MVTKVFIISNLCLTLPWICSRWKCIDTSFIIPLRLIMETGYRCSDQKCPHIQKTTVLSVLPSSCVQHWQSGSIQACVVYSQSNHDLTPVHRSSVSSNMDGRDALKSKDKCWKGMWCRTSLVLWFAFSGVGPIPTELECPTLLLSLAWSGFSQWKCCFWHGLPLALGRIDPTGGYLVSLEGGGLPIC